MGGNLDKDIDLDIYQILRISNFQLKDDRVNLILTQNLEGVFHILS